MRQQETRAESYSSYESSQGSGAAADQSTNYATTSDFSSESKSTGYMTDTAPAMANDESYGESKSTEYMTDAAPAMAKYESYDKASSESNQTSVDFFSFLYGNSSYNATNVTLNDTPSDPESPPMIPSWVIPVAVSGVISIVIVIAVIVVRSKRNARLARGKGAQDKEAQNPPSFSPSSPSPMVPNPDYRHGTYPYRQHPYDNHHMGFYPAHSMPFSGQNTAPTGHFMDARTGPSAPPHVPSPFVAQPNPSHFVSGISPSSPPIPEPHGELPSYESSKNGTLHKTNQ